MTVGLFLGAYMDGGIAGVVRRSFTACMVGISFLVVFYYTHAPFWGGARFYERETSRCDSEVVMRVDGRCGEVVGMREE